MADEVLSNEDRTLLAIYVLAEGRPDKPVEIGTVMAFMQEHDFRNLTKRQIMERFVRPIMDAKHTGVP